MTIYSGRILRKQLIKIANECQTLNEYERVLVSIMAHDVTRVINGYWYQLSDMGMSKIKFNEIKHTVKQQV